MKRATLAAGTLVALVVAAVSNAVAGDARQTLDEGFTLFAARRYDEAAAKFAEAAARAGAEGLDPAVAGYNRAIALLRAGRGTEAAGAFTEALRSSDPRVRESAHYQRGLALASAADAAEIRGETGEAVALLEEALTAYESAMRIDPGDEDPKVNHELVSRKKAQLAEKMGEQKKSGGAGGRSQADDAAAGEKPEGAGRPQDKESGEEAPPARQRGAEQEMRPDEARTLLDAMRLQEQSQRSRTRPPRGETQRVEKDW